jgi:glycosyltransferase involved in cell wall biosynthesis
MENKKITLSVALAVFNEEKNIKACLDSVKGLADEIIIVDGGSHDETVTIARNFRAKIIETDNPPIFHINKQKALDACHSDWILQLDADERITPSLHKEILEVIQSNTHHSGFFIARNNYFWGHLMKKGGQYPDYVIRLVKNGYASFPCKSVHEQIAIDGTVGYLKNPMDHISYRTKEDYWKKADAYTSLTAKELDAKHVEVSFRSWVRYCVIKPIQTFFSLAIRHKGILDGWYGFLFALWSSMHYPIAYGKYRETKAKG